MAPPRDVPRNLTLVTLPYTGDHQGRGAALWSAGQGTLRELCLWPGPLLL